MSEKFEPMPGFELIEPQREVLEKFVEGRVRNAGVKGSDGVSVEDFEGISYFEDEKTVFDQEESNREPNNKSESLLQKARNFAELPRRIGEKAVGQWGEGYSKILDIILRGTSDGR